jgi:hypothetical protein
MRAITVDLRSRFGLRDIEPDADDDGRQSEHHNARRGLLIRLGPLQRLAFLHHALGHDRIQLSEACTFTCNHRPFCDLAQLDSHFCYQVATFSG